MAPGCCGTRSGFKSKAKGEEWRGSQGPRSSKKHMDLRVYYQKIRKMEAELADPYVVIVSRETPDGGKAGVRTEVARGLAAKLIVEDQAVLASGEEEAHFREEMERQRAEAQEEFEIPSKIAKKSGKRQ